MNVHDHNDFTPLPDPVNKPGLKSAMRLYIAVFVLLVIFGSIAQGLHFEFGMLFTQWVVILLPALWLLRRYGVDRVSFSRFRALRLHFVPVIILLSLSFWLLNMVFAVGLVTGLIELGYEPVIVLEPPQTFQSYLFYLLVLAFSAGICEEVLFRGTIMPALEDSGPIPAVVFSSLLFALFHVSFLNLFSTFVLGAVMAVVVIKTGSLWGGVLYHMLNNFYAVTYMFILGNQETSAEIDPQALWGLLPLLILGAVAAFFSLRLLQNRSGQEPLLRAWKGNLLPAGWFGGLIVAGFLIFLIMALLEFAVGFGWFGLGT